MAYRIRFITHQGKQILLVDLSNCSTAEVERIVRAVPEVVTTRPRASVLILSDFTGASFDEEAIRAMKESAVFDKPYVKRSAWVGAENFPDLFSDFQSGGAGSGSGTSECSSAGAAAREARSLCQKRLESFSPGPDF